MTEINVVRQLKAYFAMHGITYVEAARISGYHSKYFYRLLKGNDINVKARLQILEHFPDATFLIPDVLKVDDK